MLTLANTAPLLCPSPTCVQSNAYPDWNVRHVSHFEGSYGAEDVEGHVCNFHSVAVAIWNRKSRCHHVSVADCLHL